MKSAKDPSRSECANCGTVDLPLHKCGKCKVTMYCGRPCQTQHWKADHKARCVPIDARKPSAEVRPSGVVCAICLDMLKEPLCTLPCGHSFHTECVGELRKFGVKQACPSCRADLPPGAEKQFDEAMRRYIGINRNASWALRSNGQKREIYEILQLFKEASDQGHVEAQVMLGCIYKDGNCAPKNHLEALRLFRKAADQGNANAQFGIGVIYNDGLGVQQDYEEAVKWYGKAADQGLSTAQYVLGVMYSVGRGVARDDHIAVELFRKVSALGNDSAQLSLGLMYELGRGVEKSVPTAMQWYRKAAAQGNEEARLGVLRCAHHV